MKPRAVVLLALAVVACQDQRPPPPVSQWMVQARKEPDRAVAELLEEEGSGPRTAELRAHIASRGLEVPEDLALAGRVARIDDERAWQAQALLLAPATLRLQEGSPAEREALLPVVQEILVKLGGSYADVELDRALARGLWVLADMDPRAAGEALGRAVGRVRIDLPEYQHARVGKLLGMAMELVERGPMDRDGALLLARALLGALEPTASARGLAELDAWVNEHGTRNRTELGRELKLAFDKGINEQLKPVAGRKERARIRASMTGHVMVGRRRMDSR